MKSLLYFLTLCAIMAWNGVPVFGQTFWVGGASGSWATPSRWSSGTVPGSSDVVFFDPASNGGITNVTVTDIPSTSLSGLNISAGNAITFLAPANTILTVSGGISINGTLHLGDYPAGTNARITLLSPNAFVNPSGMLFVGDNAAVRVSSSFNLQSGGTLITSRIDGINGTSELTGAVQVVPMAGIASYNSGANIGFAGGAVQTANFNCVGDCMPKLLTQFGKNGSTIHAVGGRKDEITGLNTLIMNKLGGTNSNPQTLLLNFSAPTNISLSGGIQFNGTGNEMLIIGQNATLNLNGATTLGPGKKIRVEGSVNNGGTVNVSGNAEIEMVGSANWAGTEPAYSPLSILRYTGAGDKTVGNEIPPTGTLNANLIIAKSSGMLTRSLSASCVFGGIVAISSAFTINRNDFSAGFGTAGNVIQSGGIFTIDNISVFFGSFNITGLATVTVEQGGIMRVQGGAVSLSSSALTIRNGGLLERNISTGIISGGDVVYEANATLRHYGIGNSLYVAPGPDFYAPFPANIAFDNVGTTNIQFPAAIAGSLTVGTSNTTTLPDAFVVNGTFNLFGTLQLPDNSVTTLNGSLNLIGTFRGINSTPTTDLIIGGSGAVTGSFKVFGNTFNGQTLEINRAGMTLPLGSPLILGAQTSLKLQRGNIRTDASNILILTNNNTSPPTALSGENPNSYIDGPLQRYLPTNAVNVSGEFRFPVGKNGKYMPFSMAAINTGGNAPVLQAEVFDTAPPTMTRDTSLSALSTTEYWRVDLLSGSFTSGIAALERSQPIATNSVVAKAPSTGGVFASIGRSTILPPNPSGGLYNYVIGSNPFTSFSLFAIATPTPPAPVVIPPALQASVTSFTPTIGTSGTTIIVTGANFNMVQGATIGGVPVPYMVETPQRLRLGPVGSINTGAIQILTATNGTATSGTFTFVPPPTISSVMPVRSGIGQIITINGTHLVETPRASVGLADILPQVNIGEVGANSVQVVAPNQLRVSFPSVTSASLRVQAWGGFATTATVEILPPPVIVSVMPTVLPAGFPVTVSGANFSYASAVRVGGIPALSFTVNSPNRITVIVPPGARGGVSVTTPGGTVTNATVVNVIPPPVITAVQPASALVGTPITITGLNFVNVSSVLIGGIRATFTADSSGSVITAIIPRNGATTSSFANVSVTALGGTITSTQRVLVLAPQGPVLTGFSPNPANVGGTLQLAGVNLPTDYLPGTVSVSVNGVIVPVQSVTNGVITLALPANILPNSLVSTNATIALTTPDGSTTASFLVPVLAPNAPALTSFTPAIGNATTSIIITGRNFDVAPRGTILGVSVAGIPVRSFMVRSTTEIVAVLGTLSPVATTGSVAVSTPSGILTLAQAFRYDPAYVPPVPVAVNDSLALVAIYRASGGAGWANRGNWLQDYVSTWYGVKVANGRVVELRLPNNGLSGQFGASTLPELAALDALKVLDLAGNRLAGVLPQSLASMRSLETLNIADNIIVGEIQQIVCGMQNLKQLNAANNRIQGELSGIVCCLARLESALLQNNIIGGGIPFCLKNLQSLTVLDASNNRLSDTLPAWLGDAPVLQELRLRGNLLRGKLPPEWGQRTRISASAAKQTASTQALEGLSTLDLAQNQLSGGLPTDWSGLISLRELNLEQNALTGAVPVEWQNLRSLRKLSLANNRITAIPDFTPIRRLDTLQVEGNALTFGSLEANSPIRVFSYAPQSEVGSPSTSTGTIDALFSQRFLTDGTQNRYEWRKITLSGAIQEAVQTTFPASNDGIMRIAAFQPTDTGLYRCVISNPLLPNLLLTSATVRVLSTTPNVSPQAVVLIAPVRGEAEVALRPVLAWVPAAGASHYDIELATNSAFTPVSVRDRVPQSLDGLLSGRLDALAPLLQPETRYFWRVRAVNSVGAGAWSDVRDLRDFRTVRADVAVSVETLNFGNVPRLDTANALLRITNVTNTPITLNDVRFAASFVAFRAIANITIAPGQAFTLPVGFIPQTLGVLTSPVTLAYTLGGTRSERSFDARLNGRGVALKVVPPDFEDVIVNRPRISSGIIINRGDKDAVVKKIEVLSAKAIYEFLPNSDSLYIGVGDTASAVFRCRPRTVGTVQQGLVRYEANIDTAEVPLTANARFLRAGEVVAKIGIRAVPPSAPPGAAVTLELFLQSTPNEPITPAQRQVLFQQLQPTADATISFSRNVLALGQNATLVARRVRNTAAQNRTERVQVPLSAWDERTNGNVLARIPVVAVAGEFETTQLFVEDVNWVGTAVESDTTLSTFRSEACEAGGKRLVTTAKATALAVIAPNPAKDVITISYTLREDSFAEIALVDMRGSVIARALQGEQQAGEYVLTFPLTGIPQGAYSLRLSTPNAVVVRRVEVVR